MPGWQASQRRASPGERAGCRACDPSVKDNDAVLSTDPTVGDGRDEGPKGTAGPPPSLNAPDPAWRIYQARGLGLDEPWSGKPVEQQHCHDRGQARGNQTGVVDQEGNHPRSGDHQQDANSKRPQRKQRNLSVISVEATSPNTRPSTTCRCRTHCAKPISSSLEGAPMTARYQPGSTDSIPHLRRPVPSRKVGQTRSRRRSANTRPGDAGNWRGTLRRPPVTTPWA
jgi:hypothetical protein